MQTRVAESVWSALQEGRAVVALESALITHGLPYPLNVQTAEAAEEAVRAAGAVPATIAIIDGTIRIGGIDLDAFAQLSNVRKASRRDLAAAMVHGACASTTVSATMFLASVVGIKWFATGGIGGAHRPPADPFDISADLMELSRVPVNVVCSGAKSVLDIARTLEILETLGVPTVGWQTDLFPAFHVATTAWPVSIRCDSAEELVRIANAHTELADGGLLVVQPVNAEVAIEPTLYAEWVTQIEAQAQTEGVRGAKLTPYLLQKLAEISGGKTLQANQALIVANAKLAGELAVVAANLAKAAAVAGEAG